MVVEYHAASERRGLKRDVEALFQSRYMVQNRVPMDMYELRRISRVAAVVQIDPDQLSDFGTGGFVFFGEPFQNAVVERKLPEIGVVSRPSRAKRADRPRA